MKKAKLLLENILKTILACSVLVISVIISFSTSNAYADYEESRFRLVHNPTIYAVMPYPDPTIPNLDTELSQKTQSAILDWKNQLNIGGGRKPIWDMNVVEISFSQANSNPSLLSQADIQIFYLPSPTSTPDVEEPVGVTTYDVTNHKAKIIIYYKKLTFSLTTTETRDSNYIYYHYIPVSSYSDQLASDAQLSMAIEHELGHALGIGHYKISEDEKNNILSGKETEIPSIMIPVVVPIGTNHYAITSSDVHELKSLYGQNGFNQSISPTILPTTSIPESPTLQTPEESVTNNPKYDVFRDPLLSNIQNGHISDVNFGNSFFALGEDGLIHVNMYEKSNGSIIKPRWFDSVIALWAQNKISDKDYASCIQYLYDSKLLQM